MGVALGDRGRVRVRPSVARRAGLSQSELVALEHRSRAPVGPGQLARLLGVTTAASTGVVDRLVSTEGTRRGTLARTTDDAPT